MPSSDYTNAIGGGLKLKGAKDAGVKKHKKKTQKSKPETGTAGDTTTKPGDEVKDGDAAVDKDLQKALAEEDEQDSGRDSPAAKAHTETSSRGAGKTEAQRRHDEVRRKRLDERLQREGVKTHKQRVEELNKYLSRLSEHHDMPRIGPG